MERVLITGANRGIGLELTRQYAARGAQVFALCRQPQQAQALNAIAAAHPGQISVLPLELRDPASIQAAAQAVQAQTDALDLLINNAGINPPGTTQSLETATAETLLDVLHVNSAAPVLVTQALLPLLKAGGREVHPARVVNISSQMGSITNKASGGYYAYCTSKAALNMISRAMGHDLRPYGIVALALDPGWVQTDMGGSGAPLTPEESAAGILRVLDSLSLNDAGTYRRWNGESLPW